jgi:hypothetical protein
LPEGIYTATVVAAAHRITRAVNLVINDSGTTVQNFWLPPAPKILLVDSGRWYQESEIGSVDHVQQGHHGQSSRLVHQPIHFGQRCERGVDILVIHGCRPRSMSSTFRL